MKAVVSQFKYGQHTVTLETGSFARQANAAVLARFGDTAVLATVVADARPKSGLGFLPLTVSYQEKAYAAGKIPGSFFRREGRPGESEILISRLIDRPIRPLFPKGFNHEVQLILSVLSVEPEIHPDLVAMVGASAALAISGLPCAGPLGAARVGYQGGKYLLNPTQTELSTSDLDLVVAGTSQAILMVESQVNVLSEDEVLGAILFGHTAQQGLIREIEAFRDEVGSPAAPIAWSAAKAEGLSEELKASIEAFAMPLLPSLCALSGKCARHRRMVEILELAHAHFSELGVDVSTEQLKEELEALNSRWMRRRIVEQGIRLDGREADAVRALELVAHCLPRAHGSALFTRGETQALVVATLGTERDAQTIDELVGERTDRFLFHYNFPPYAVGEVGQLGFTKRREVGHGRLAKRSLVSVLPSAEEFPYTIRVVSEILESNGSSSMASVCGASLALMDAGVPLKSPVAGIAMGLIKDEAAQRYVVLTDILGEEDHLGDMDFKVAGTREGITALQMDIKIAGIDEPIMRQALEQAKWGRLHILEVMNRALPTPRDSVSTFAPRIQTLQIPTEKIKVLIGKGGATIRNLTETFSTTIEVDDKGNIKVAGNDMDSVEQTISRIEELVTDLEVGRIYSGQISRLMEFGALVDLPGSKSGLLHISQIAEKRVDKVSDHLEMGQLVDVKVLEIDRQGRIRLSLCREEEDVASTVASDLES